MLLIRILVRDIEGSAVRWSWCLMALTAELSVSCRKVVKGLLFMFSAPHCTFASIFHFCPHPCSP